MINKKQVATWIVTGVLVAGAGAALAEGGTEDPSLGTTSETTLVDETTTTVAEATTTTEVVDATTTTTAGSEDVAADGEDGPGNSVAAHNHECDEAWGNHGAWVSANAHAMKTGDEVSCDGPADVAATTGTTDTTVAADDTDDTQDAADDTADDAEDTAVTTSSPTHGMGHAKKR